MGGCPTTSGLLQRQHQLVRGWCHCFYQHSGTVAEATSTGQGLVSLFLPAQRDWQGKESLGV